MAITYSLGQHNNKPVIWVRFDYNPKLNAKMSSIAAKWSQTNKAWYTPDTVHFRKLFKLDEKIPIGKTVLNKISETNIPALNNLRRELILKAYSTSTQKTYLTEFAQLLYILKDHPVDKLNTDRLKSYFLFCIEKQKISENQLHSRINAIKFYFEQVLHRPKIFFEIPRPKKPSIVPKVISKNDILKMLGVLENKKHKLMLSLCYGMGLRVSEIVNIKITDLDSSNMQVLIQRAKGKKDRYVNLPASTLTDLRNYYSEYKPKIYLFEGQYGGQYSVRSVQAVFKQAMQKAKVNKAVGIHGMRHSYATHLLERGVDISYIQKLLGHNDIKTTLRYAQVTHKDIRKIKSPLDT